MRRYAFFVAACLISACSDAGTGKTADNSYYFHLLDLNGDSYVEYNEAAADPKLFLQKFKELDKNGDGKIDAKEFSEFKPDSPQARRPG